MEEFSQTANPYVAPAARIAQPIGDEGFSKASRGSRLGAYLIDALLFALCFGPGYYGLITSEVSVGAGFNTIASVAALAGLVLILYNCVQLYRHGQTVGKKWVGIRIARTDGTRASFGRILGLRAVVPTLIGAIPLIGAFFTLVDVLLIFGNERRCIHDYLADTIVIDA